MEYFLLLILLEAIVSCQDYFPTDIELEQWNIFKNKYGKKYSNASEEQSRLIFFLENYREVVKNNELYEKGFEIYKLGLNKYADLSCTEFSTLMTGLHKTKKRTPRSSKSHDYVPETFVPPDNYKSRNTVDWRKKGALTPIKDQGHCGSCWAFSAAGSLEAHYYLKTKKLIPLSKQNLMDCSRSYGNAGCDGGLMDYAFLYTMNNGIATEQSYPYKAVNRQCSKFNNSDVTIRGFVVIEYGNEEHLKAAVDTVGPVAVGIDASPVSFHLYSSGVYKDLNCSSKNLSHAVLVVGYGNHKKTKEDYWLVKNSWGASWGNKGYMKIARNRDNLCGIASMASYPLI